MPNPLKYNITFTIRVDQEFLDAVEELRRLQDPIPSKSDVIRDLVMDAASAPGREKAALVRQASRGSDQPAAPATPRRHAGRGRPPGRQPQPRHPPGLKPSRPASSPSRHAS